MDYKKIIKSRALRIRIMQALSFVPDRTMVKIQYRLKTGRRLDLNNPKRFTEKLQWYKLYYRDPLMAQCADKYEVRRYIRQCGLESLLNELYGVYDTPDEIDFNKLPQSFVLKDTLGGGGNSVILVPDKEKLDRENACARMWNWVNEPVNKKHPGREWVYDGRKHRILVEKYIESDPGNGGLIDYKFFCFQGTAEYLYVIADRELGRQAGMGIFHADFERLDVRRVGEKELSDNMKKPENYDRMRTLAEQIAAPFPEARVDFYNRNGKVIFGEITFFNASGYMLFEPDEFDYIMGEKFSLKNIM